MGGIHFEPNEFRSKAGSLCQSWWTYCMTVRYFGLMNRSCRYPGFFGHEINLTTYNLAHINMSRQSELRAHIDAIVADIEGTSA